MQTLKENLIRQITEAFKNVPPPANNFGIYSAEAADDYRDPTVAEALRDRQLRSQDITIRHLYECPSALSFLNPDGFLYYLPVYMILTLRYEDDPKYSGYGFMDSPEYRLYAPDEGLREHIEERHARFDEAQIEAAIAYLEYQRLRYDSEVNRAAITYWQARLRKLRAA